VRQEPEDLVPGGVAGDLPAGLLDHARVVAAQHHRELVVGHASEGAGGQEGVDRVDRGGLDPDQQLLRADLRGGQLVAQTGRGVEAVQRERMHRTGSFGRRAAWPANTIGISTIRDLP
jgi:hypothetical protein